MKTQNEICEKIDRLMERKRNMVYPADKEQVLCQIDALLWVLEDASGLPLLDEREVNRL